MDLPFAADALSEFLGRDVYCMHLRGYYTEMHTLLREDLVPPIPQAFCWTKMGTESGEQLQSILRRKDWERALGDGVFYWGIGNGLGGGIDALVTHTTRPQVIFSPIRTKARAVDANPGAVRLWLTYLGADGVEVPLPRHVLVTSRASGAEGQSRHFALCCRSLEALTKPAVGRIEFPRLRNLVSGKKLGHSQVTSIVAYGRDRLGESGTLVYDVALRAELVAPYCVRLHRGVLLSEGDQSELAAAQQDSGSIETWERTVLHVKQRAWATIGRSGNNPLEEQLMLRI